MARLLTPPSMSDLEVAKRWVIETYHAADTKGIAIVIEFLTQDATVYFGRSHSIQGRASIERLCLWEAGACTSIAHSISHIEVLPDRTSVTLVADYLFTNGVKKAAKCFVVWYKRPTDTMATRSDIRGELDEVINETVSIQGPPSF